MTRLASVGAAASTARKRSNLAIWKILTVTSDKTRQVAGSGHRPPSHREMGRMLPSLLPILDPPRRTMTLTFLLDRGTRVLSSPF
jgi:hypothetical protein